MGAIIKKIKKEAKNVTESVLFMRFCRRIVRMAVAVVFLANQIAYGMDITTKKDDMTKSAIAVQSIFDVGKQVQATEAVQALNDIENSVGHIASSQASHIVVTETETTLATVAEPSSIENAATEQEKNFLSESMSTIQKYLGTINDSVSSIVTAVTDFLTDVKKEYENNYGDVSLQSIASQLAQNNSSLLTDAGISALSSWLATQGEKIVNCAVKVVYSYLKENNVSADENNIAGLAIISDIMQGVITSSTKGDLATSLYSIKSVLSSRGVDMNGYEITSDMLAGINTPFLAVQMSGENGHIVLVKNVSGDVVTYEDAGVSATTTLENFNSSFINVILSSAETVKEISAVEIKDEVLKKISVSADAPVLSPAHAGPLSINEVMNSQIAGLVSYDIYENGSWQHGPFYSFDLEFQYEIFWNNGHDQADPHRILSGHGSLCQELIGLVDVDTLTQQSGTFTICARSLKYNEADQTYEISPWSSAVELNYNAPATPQIEILSEIPRITNKNKLTIEYSVDGVTHDPMEVTLADGPQYIDIYAQSTDPMNPLSYGHAKVYVVADLDVPSGSASFTGDNVINGYTKDDTATVTMNIADIAPEGFKEGTLRYTVNGGDWITEAYTPDGNPIVRQVKLTGEGKNTLCVEYEDQAGNVFKITDTV
ncbi:MAG: hypothetical protein HQL28_00885, partial [Candidatus Omnitrophica bacterium]|nr:hypothetical protein [Candidatus Omnitrophota bacterium]